MRRGTSQNVGQVVRASVPMSRADHAKLCALAALRGVDRSAIASAILRAGLAGVVVRAGPEAQEKGPPDSGELAGL